MYCSSNNFRCRDQGYCSCRDDQTAEAAGGCGGILFLAAIGIFAAFLYPAIRIFRSNIEFDDYNSPKFAGTKWLLLSPVFGFLSQMLFQLIFTFSAAALISGPSQVAALVFKAGLFTIYLFAMGLSTIAFSIKNREAIKLFAVDTKTRNVRKSLSLIALLFVLIFAALAATGIIFSSAEGYFTVRSNVQNEVEKDRQLILDEQHKFDSYVGKYRITTRNDKILFLVSKSKNEKALRLSMDSENNRENANLGCLLTPAIEGNSIYFAVSECLVEDKPSPLSKVYFRLESNKTKMDFIYNGNSSGDTLVKTK